jgi:hypothetical protein
MKYRRFASILLFFSYLCLLKGEASNTKKKFSIVRKYNISIGINYSNFLNATGNGKTGSFVGIYRNSKIGQFSFIKYGFCYSNKKVSYLNKKIRSDDFDDGTTLFISDINTNYHFIEINCMTRHNIVKNEFLLLYPVIGVGYSINILDNTKIIHKSIMSGDSPVQIFDYRYANEGIGSIFANTGFILHFGFEIEVDNYSGCVVYSYNTHNIRRAAGFLSIEDKLHSLTLIFGVNI